jgi:hypothetical protein
LAINRYHPIGGIEAKIEMKRAVQVRTDANGQARAFWRLGSDAGSGNFFVA